MNITIYIALIILLLLIILFISLKYYLVYTHSVYIEVDDDTPIENNCLYHHKCNIQFCNYVVDGKKYIITKLLMNELNKLKTKNQLQNNNQLQIFNAKNFNLPPNGKFKIRYVCDSCNGVDRPIVDDNGNPINSQGKLINSKGELINNQGNPINNQGKLINSKNTFVNAATIENEYNEMTEDYVANRANYRTFNKSSQNSQRTFNKSSQQTFNKNPQKTFNNKNRSFNRNPQKDTPTPFISVHSSSTQNSAYWNGENNSYEDQLHNIINPINNYADLISMEKRINSSIDNNDIDNTLNDIEKLENSMARDPSNDSPMSYVSNIFNRKYPKNSNTSILANIDPEYIHGGLRGDAKLLN
jgi:hypothetical protein